MRTNEAGKAVGRDTTMCGDPKIWCHVRGTGQRHLNVRGTGPWHLKLTASEEPKLFKLSSVNQHIGHAT